MHQTTAIEDPVTVPRGLLGAACAAIERKHDAPKTIEHLRRYTTGDLSVPAPATPADLQGLPDVDESPEFRRLWDLIQQWSDAFPGSQSCTDLADAIDTQVLSMLIAHGGARADATRDAVLHACSEALAGAEAAPIRGEWDRGFREGLGCTVTVVRAALHKPASRT